MGGGNENLSHLLAALLTGMRSRSRSSRSRLFSSVNLRSLRSAIDCLFFLICDGSPTSRDVYWGMLGVGRPDEDTTLVDVDGNDELAGRRGGAADGALAGGSDEDAAAEPLVWR